MMMMILMMIFSNSRTRIIWLLPEILKVPPKTKILYKKKYLERFYIIYEWRDEKCRDELSSGNGGREWRCVARCEIEIVLLFWKGKFETKKNVASGYLDVFLRWLSGLRCECLRLMFLRVIMLWRSCEICFHCYRFTDFFIDIGVLTRHATGTNYRTSMAEK